MLEFLDSQRQRVLINPALVGVVRASTDTARRGTEIVMRDGERILLDAPYDEVKSRLAQSPS